MIRGWWKSERKHLRRKKARVLRAETLESKVCLTATVAFADGNLLVSGEADGPIEISANEANQLQVSDNGEVIGIFPSVNDLTVDPDGSIWFATERSGMLIWEAVR